MTPRTGAIGALALGGLAIVGATVAGSDANLLDPIIHPPAIVRAALVGGSVAVAVVLLRAGWRGSRAARTTCRDSSAACA